MVALQSSNGSAASTTLTGPIINTFTKALEVVTSFGTLVYSITGITKYFDSSCQICDSTWTSTCLTDSALMA